MTPGAIRDIPWPDLATIDTAEEEREFFGLINRNYLSYQVVVTDSQENQLNPVSAEFWQNLTSMSRVSIYLGDQMIIMPVIDPSNVEVLLGE